MMQRARLAVGFRCTADQRQAVMVAVAAQEHHASRHHLVGIDV
jgi:hypothetical protein